MDVYQNMHQEFKIFFFFELEYSSLVTITNHFVVGDIEQS